MNELITVDPAKAALVSAALLFLGNVIKNITFIRDEWIPSILTAAGAVTYCLLMGPWNWQNLLIGIVAAKVATGLNEDKKNIQELTSKQPKEDKATKIELLKTIEENPPIKGEPAPVVVLPDTPPTPTTPPRPSTQHPLNP